MKTKLPEEITVYIGYDHREDIVYQVAKKSILEHNPKWKVVPLVQDQLRADEIYTRPKDLLAATDFSLTRFLVPHLNNYQGWAIFVDCDVLCTKPLTTLLEKGINKHDNDAKISQLTDAIVQQGVYVNQKIDELIASILEIEDNRKALWVVKHDYTPKTTNKMGGIKQTTYPRKNWSSFILFDCEHPAHITADTVNTASPSDLHQFKFYKDSQIGDLDYCLNFLVGEQPKLDNPKTYKSVGFDTPHMLHYTLGIGVFEDLATNDYAELWESYRAKYYPPKGEK